MKRLSIVLFFLLVGAGIWGWVQLNQPDEPMQATEPLRIHQGVITGGLDRDNPNIQVFNGIPYATARRWSAPTAPPQWGAMARDTREYGAECLQPRDGLDSFVNGIIDGVGLPWWKQVVARNIIRAQDTPAEAEDCLFLNVRTANRGGKRLQPVMVWIHGGSHQAGAGSQAPYQANGLVEKGVVLVTINYRLGPFGYLAHPALTEEAGTSGNYGLLDQIAALQWVQMNIASFGGDPDNVTIFGESAGAQSVSELMATPLADGLYHKAILQSGVSSYNAIHRARMELQGVRSAEDVGQEFLSSFVSATATADDLRAIPSGAIISRIGVRSDLVKYFLPNVDGKVLPEAIGQAIRSGNAMKVPVLAGYNADEGTLFYDRVRSPTVLRMNMTGTLDQREAMLEDVFGVNSAKALQALYGMTSAESWDKGATDMLGDDMFGVHTRFLGRASAMSGQPTWLYHFTHTPHSKSQKIGAHHAAEIPFVFDSHDSFLPAGEDDETLTDIMLSYWTNFAKTGNPNGEGLPEWPAYDPESDTWLGLGHTIEPIEGLRARKLDILEENLNRRLDRLTQPQSLVEESEGSTLLSAPLDGEERVADSD